MADSMNPNVFVVDPDGTISAVLSGHLRAKGVDLPVGVDILKPSLDSRVKWLLPDGSVAASVSAFDTPGYPPEQNVVMETLGGASFAGEPGAIAGAATIKGGGAKNAGVYAQGGPNAIAGAWADLVTRTIIDSDGNSHFLQLLAGASKKRLAVGVGLLAPAVAAGAVSPSQAIAHGLGVSPWFYMAIPFSSRLTYGVAAASDATNFYAEFRNNSAAATATNGLYLWIAIG